MLWASHPVPQLDCQVAKVLVPPKVVLVSVELVSEAVPLDAISHGMVNEPFVPASQL